MSFPENFSIPDNAPLRIVIVDDYDLMRLALRLKLQEDPDIITVGEADDGESSLTTVRQSKPDVVLMDLGLPGINGFETTRIIKQLHPQVKIIMLTSHDAAYLMKTAYEAGADAYCLKDTSARDLLQVIHNVMNGQGWTDSFVLFQNALFQCLLRQKAPFSMA